MVLTYTIEKYRLISKWLNLSIIFNQLRFVHLKYLKVIKNLIELTILYQKIILINKLKGKNRSYEMSSFVETTAFNLHKEKPTEFVK